MKRFSSMLIVCILFTLIFPFQTSQAGAPQRGPDSPTSEENLPIAWLSAKESNGIAYFMTASPASLKRFDLAAGAWTNGYPVSQDPVAFAVDESGIYIAYANSITHMDLSGGAETPLASSTKPVLDLLTLDGYLLVFTQDEVTSLNRQTGAKIDATYLLYYFSVLTASPGLHMIFGRTKSSMPELFMVPLNPDGTFGEYQEGLNWPELPYSTGPVFALPGDRRVLDSSGMILFTSDLSYSSSLPTAIDDMAAYGSQIVTIYKGGLVSYDSEFRKLGEYFPIQPAQKVFTYGEMLYTFYSGASCIEAYHFPASLLRLSGEASSLDPADLPYWPAAFEMGADETLYLLDRQHLSIYRWSVPQRKYLASIPLSQPPDYMAYSGVTNRLYLAYSSGKITQIKLDDSLAELPFVQIQKPFDIEAAGEFLVAVDYGDIWLAHRVFDPQGVQVSSLDKQYTPLELVWDGANHRMFYLPQGTHPLFLNYESIDVNGQVSDHKDNYQVFTNEPPVRVAPDGSLVVVGSGNTFNGADPTITGTLGTSFVDAAWSGSDFYTAEHFESGFQLVRHDAAYQPVSSQPIFANDIRLFDVSEGLLVVTYQGGRPTFSILKNDLTGLYRETRSLIYLPVASNSFRTLDTFSDASSGWPSGSGGSSSYGYQDGHFRVVTKQPGYIYSFLSPFGRAEYYTVAVDAEFKDSPGAMYGLMIDVVGGYEHYLMFGVAPAEKKFYTYVYDGVSLHDSAYNLVQGINPDRPNRLEVTRTHLGISFSINGEVVLPNFSFPMYPTVSRVGVFVVSGGRSGVSETWFDNFSMLVYPGAYAPLPDPSTITGSSCG